jgi:hypothetical protein
MYTRHLIAIAVFAAVATQAHAQSMQRRATMVRGGSPDRGKCTIEVVVDGAAEVELRGDTATLRNLKGQLPQWRRFECTGVMPANPADFRFAGVDGRGSQRLMRDPRGGGPAVVQIEDPDNGSEGYTFDITWGGGSGYPVTQDRGGRDDRGYRQPWSREDAIRSCQDAVRQEATGRFDRDSVEFRRIEADNNPGRRDSVDGIFDVRRRDGRLEAYRFTCSVDFDSARLFDARIMPLDNDRGSGNRDRDTRDVSPADRAIRSCQTAVEQRVARDGYRDPSIESIRVDDRPGRNDWVVGRVRADARGGRAAFDFSCSVDLRDGDVRSVDVQPRY